MPHTVLSSWCDSPEHTSRDMAELLHVVWAKCSLFARWKVKLEDVFWRRVDLNLPKNGNISRFRRIQDETKTFLGQISSSRLCFLLAFFRLFSIIFCLFTVQDFLMLSHVACGRRRTQNTAPKSLQWMRRWRRRQSSLNTMNRSQKCSNDQENGEKSLNFLCSFVTQQSSPFSFNSTKCNINCLPSLCFSSLKCRAARAHSIIKAQGVKCLQPGWMGPCLSELAGDWVKESQPLTSFTLC